MLVGRHLCLAAAVLLLLTFAGHARTGNRESRGDEVPKIILSGLEAYKAEGPEAAIKAWLKGSPIEGSKEALSQANSLRQIEDFYGAYKTFQLIRSKDLTPTTRIVYLTLDYEKGPVFGKFVAYRQEKGWILTNFKFNTNDDAIIPACP